MDLLRIIAELQTEKQRLDEAILALERLSSINNPRRGRASRWTKNDKIDDDSDVASPEGASVEESGEEETAEVNQE